MRTVCGHFYCTTKTHPKEYFFIVFGYIQTVLSVSLISSFIISIIKSYYRNKKPHRETISVRSFVCISKAFGLWGDLPGDESGAIVVDGDDRSGRRVFGDDLAGHEGLDVRLDEPL